jgi:hypothetical protein
MLKWLITARQAGKPPSSPSGKNLPAANADRSAISFFLPDE